MMGEYKIKVGSDYVDQGLEVICLKAPDWMTALKAWVFLSGRELVDAEYLIKYWFDGSRCFYSLVTYEVSENIRKFTCGTSPAVSAIIDLVKVTIEPLGDEDAL